MRKHHALFLISLCGLLLNCAAASLNTAFTYQGRLKDGANPANGSYDLRFALYTAGTGGSQTGPTLIYSPVAITNGLFTATLDFGAGLFDGTALWLEIGVRTNSGEAFSTLSPRQPIMPTPYALYALTPAGPQGPKGDKGDPGAVGPSYIAGNGLSLVGNQLGVNFAGSGFASTAARSDHDHDASYWKLGGNSGTTPAPPPGAPEFGPTNFLATTDNQPLEFWVNNTRALRIEPGNTFPESPNLIGGYSGNSVAANVIGATITGGGGVGVTFVPDSTILYPNRVTADYGTVCGGLNNIASGDSATVAGGFANNAAGIYSFAAGGIGNYAAGFGRFAAGTSAAAAHDGVFVWGDSATRAAAPPTDQIKSTGPNQFIARATGGVYFITATNVTTSPDNTIGYTVGARLSPGSSSWSSLSDRRAKENVAPVDPKGILEKLAAVPVATWNYRAQNKSIRHMGPMAQDFYEAFGVGEDDTHITTVDADGVALGAIQGLNQIVKEQATEIQDLKKTLADLQELVSRLDQQQNGGKP